MQLAHEQLRGLDRGRLLSVVEPVLLAHGVDGVDLVWRSDQHGWVLELTVERPGSTAPGAGVTLDACAEISRDLSAALDVADVVPNHYRLEVGTPGVERRLYRVEDYERFAGRVARLKLTEPVEGQFVLRGRLEGLDGSGRVKIVTDWGEQSIEMGSIDSARLVFEFGTPEAASNSRSSRGNRRHGGRRGKAHPRRSR